MNREENESRILRLRFRLMRETLRRLNQFQSVVTKFFLSVRILIGTVYIVVLPTAIVLKAIEFQGKSTPESLGDRLHGYLSVLLAQGVFAGLLFLGGTILFAFRCQSPLWYGRLEILVGLFIGTYVVNAMLGIWPPGAAVFFTTIGALYIVVRGYDNIYKSKTAGTDDIRWWNRAFFFKDTDLKL